MREDVLMFINLIIAVVSSMIAMVVKLADASTSIIIGIVVLLVMMIATEVYIIRKTGDWGRAIIPWFLLMLLALVMDLYFRVSPSSGHLPVDVWIIVALFGMGAIALVKKEAILSWMRSRPRPTMPDNQ